MTDAHCHQSGGDDRVRELVCGERFVGIHPWDAAARAADLPRWLAEMESRLIADAALGVGEIGLDRLRDREISAAMREVFERQLALAFKYRRPVVLHGAKCWGEVVRAVRAAALAAAANPPPLLFHGFSRSAGLIPDIVALGGFISVGPAVLNLHAVNYRRLVAELPAECLLLETDRTAESAAECPPLAEIAAETARIRGRTAAEIEALTDANALRFCPE